MLFVVLILMVSSTVIESRFMVKTLPGFDGDLPFTLETGYIGVGESDNVQLYYYFIESEGNPKDNPLLFWLTGGPGCSGISSLLYENGPLTIDYANSTLEKTMLEINPHRWTKIANILFIDQPAGTGFSYAKTPEAYITNDTLSTKLAYTFLRKWLADHPKFLNNPLYLGGISYVGVMLPMIVQEIYNGNEAGEATHININIKGYMLGNPFTTTSGDYNFRITYAHHMALLSDAIYKSANENCGGEYLNVDPNNTVCIHALEMVDKCIGRINQFQILEPYCDATSVLKSDLLLEASEKTSVDNLWSTQLQKQGCRDDNYIYSYVWANSRDVREALHIRQEFGEIKWVRCNYTISYNHVDELPKSYTHDVFNIVDYHRRFADKNCRALIFSGDHDMVFPYLSTMNWIESLNLPVVDDWRPWLVDEQVAGYTVKYSKDDFKLTFATVKGAGHTAPEYKPKECLNMFMRWLADETL